MEFMVTSFTSLLLISDRKELRMSSVSYAFTRNREGYDSNLAMLVSEKEDETVHQLGEVLEHVDSGLAVEHRNPGNDKTTDVGVVHRQVLLQQGDEALQIDGAGLGDDLLQ